MKPGTFSRMGRLNSFQVIHKTRFYFRCQVSGVRCQEKTEDSSHKTACAEPIGRELRAERLSRVDDGRQKTDCFLPTLICMLTPEH